MLSSCQNRINVVIIRTKMKQYLMSIVALIVTEIKYALQHVIPLIT